jgi:hypothetical protein
MQTNLEKVDCDPSAEWLALAAKVRILVSRLHEKVHGTPFQADTAELIGETSLLCDHLVRIHHGAGNLLAELDEPQPESTTPNLNEVQREAIQIHRETHELRADFKDIIKALFMWQDDPAERVQRKG